MRLTTKGRFAVTAMMDLAMRGDDGPVALVVATASPARLIRSRLPTSFMPLMNSLTLPSAGDVRTAMMSTAA